MCFTRRFLLAAVCVLAATAVRDGWSQTLTIRGDAGRDGTEVGGAPAVERSAALVVNEVPGGTALTPLSGRASSRPRQGSVVGTVTLRGLGTPLSSAQVYIPGTGIGALTNASGRYLLPSVPAGEHTLRVERLGYGPVQRTVLVREDASTVENFELSEEALALDAIVVTGTPGQARRREVGNTVAQVTVTDVVAAPTNIDALLRGRVAGLNVTGVTGQAGTGADIRLRGVVSVAMSNQPLIYIDGVRVRGDAYPTNNPPVGGSAQLYGPFNRNSPLNDINPEDIERVEVVKGAAATTLYGTEAAVGVIQIFTKRGRSGRPVWDLRVDQGISKILPFGVRETLRGTPVESLGVVHQAGGTPQYWFLDPWLRNAWQQSYNLSVRGGTELLRYYLSGSFDDRDFPLPSDSEKKYSVRGNFGIALSEQFLLDWNTSLNASEVHNTSTGNNVHGLTLNVIRDNRNYMNDGSKEKLDSLLDQELKTQIDRLTTGVTLSYTPVPHFTNRFTAGYDRSEWEGTNLRPYGFILWKPGFMSVKRFTNSTVSLDYVGTYELRLASELRSSFSFGVQSIRTEEHDLSGWSEEFPGPGLPTISTGAKTLATETRLKVITGGGFAQSLFDYKNRYFLTVGLRVDGNSAFGQDFGLQAYPKASFSYVLSDEGFWPESWGEVKLRAAYGHAGRAPGAFDAVRTWTPDGWGGQPAFRPRNVGNAGLGPERTGELEVGFDAAFLDNRLSTEFTYYVQKTTGALLSVRQIPSEGNWGSQLENVGKLQNKGVELAVDATLIRKPSLTWAAGFTLSTNFSEVLSLGGAPSFSVGNYGFVREGDPVGVLVGINIKNPREVAEPVLERNYAFGPSQPTHIWLFRTSFSLPGGLELAGRGEYQTGGWVNDGGTRFGLTRGAPYPHCYDAVADIEAGRRDNLTAQERIWCIPQRLLGDVFMYPKTFFKLREVWLRIPLGTVVPRTSDASVTLSGQNVWTWLHKDFLAWDPEQGGFFGAGYLVNRLWEHTPPPAVFTASARVTF
ncbi:MAG: TonB-dependent receptor [Gemmatimonadetes bacterium]|nr:TonB-dependent receptor [Gemmatimonadota bacterium]